MSLDYGYKRRFSYCYQGNYPIKSNGQSEPNKIFDSDNIQPGIWQVMEPLHQDHHIVIGHKFINLDVNKMKLFYKEICNRLYELD